MKLFRTIFFVLIFVSILSCSTNQNEINLSSPELAQILMGAIQSGNDAITFPLYIFLSGMEIDDTLTANCGYATPAYTTAIPGQTMVGQPMVGTGQTGTTPSRFTIISQLYMKKTKETLMLKFIYDMNQFQGAIDPQQGFIMTGGLFTGTTLKATQGIVKWSNQGIGYIDSSSTGVSTQTLSFFDIELNLTGYYQPATTSTSIPNQCNTLDGIKCTTSYTNGATCYTYDNISCATSSAGGTLITIVGRLNCNAKNIRPN